VVISRHAPKRRVSALAKRVNVVTAPAREGHIDLRWLLKKLGAEHVTSLLVEGGGEVNASFLMSRLAHRVAFFYAPQTIGGLGAVKAVAGLGAGSLPEALRLREIEWRRLGSDLFMTARVGEA
jgi:diaminohydroxyphosphoribosylaminopyrimidine deaminase/5-amino-6-(5-phosphoribosylamino)uracil reductase